MRTENIVTQIDTSLVIDSMKKSLFMPKMSVTIPNMIDIVPIKV